MCLSTKPDSTLTVKSSDPLSKVAKTSTTLEDMDPDAAINTIPSLTDEKVAEARRLQLQRLLAGRGRRSTFLTGPGGSAGTKQSPLLGG